MAAQQNSPGTSETDAKTLNYVNVLVVGTDLAFAKSVQNALQTVQADNPDKNYRIFPGINKEKILEYTEKFQLHSVLVDEDYINDTTPESWLKDLRELLKKNPQNQGIPVILACTKGDASKTRKLLQAGWRDLFMKPLDTSIFLQKMHLYNPAIPLLTEDLLFTWDTDKEADIALRLKTKSLSEIGMKVETAAAVAPNTVVMVKMDFLEAPLTAQVQTCAKVNDSSFTLELLFMGLNPAETQAIRRFIRQEYAEEKQAA